MNKMTPDTLREAADTINGFRRPDPIEGIVMAAVKILLHADAWEADRERIEALERLARRLIEENCGHRKCYECGSEEIEPHGVGCLVGEFQTALREADDG